MTQNAINRATFCLQKLTTTIGTVVTCSTTIPGDDTIPQNTEGTEVLTVTITPKYSDSLLHVEFSTSLSSNTNSPITIALFQDSTADALSGKCAYRAASSTSIDAFLQYVMTSGTTSATTFKIRVGQTSGTTYLNANNTGGAVSNGISNTRLTVTEYK